MRCELRGSADRVITGSTCGRSAAEASRLHSVLENQFISCIIQAKYSHPFLLPLPHMFRASLLILFQPPWCCGAQSHVLVDGHCLPAAS